MTVGQLARQLNMDVNDLFKKLEMSIAEPEFTPRVKIRLPRYAVRKPL